MSLAPAPFAPSFRVIRNENTLAEGARIPPCRKLHLGTFEGEALRRAGGFSPHRRQDDRLDRDIASAVAIVAFVASVAVVVAGILNIGAPV